MASRIYDFTLAANVGASQRMDVLGSQCKVITSPAGPIRIRTEKGEIFDCLEGQGFQLPEGQTFNNLTISNLQALANAGTVFIGDDLFVDSRVTGIVQVVDTAKATTIAGYAYSASIGASPGAAQFGSHQLVNPAGSGKRIVVEAVLINASAAAIGIQLGFLAAPTGVQGGNIVNHLSGGPASIAQMWNKQDHAADPAALIAGGALWGVFVGANAQVIWTPKRPVVLLPGSALFSACRTANASSSAQFDYYEEPNT